MLCLMLIATPDADNDEFKQVGGAYVNCWIDFPQEDGAEMLARHYITQAGWLPGKLEECGLVSEEQYHDEAEPLAYFREAKESGVSLAFYCWPNEAEDTDVEYSAARSGR